MRCVAVRCADHPTCPLALSCTHACTNSKGGRRSRRGSSGRDRGRGRKDPVHLLLCVCLAHSFASIYTTTPPGPTPPVDGGYTYLSIYLSISTSPSVSVSICRGSSPSSVVGEMARTMTRLSRRMCFWARSCPLNCPDDHEKEGKGRAGE